MISLRFNLKKIFTVFIVQYAFYCILPGSITPSHVHDSGFDFGRYAAKSSAVVIGEPLSFSEAKNWGFPQLQELYERHAFSYIKVHSVLAVTGNYIDNNGRVDFPEYIIIPDNGLSGSGWHYPYRCKSMFFLKPVLSFEHKQWLYTDMDVVKQFSVEHGLDDRMFFEISSGSWAVPLLSKERYESTVGHKAGESWEQDEQDLAINLGIRDFSDFELFTRKALLPFFKQIDQEWFIGMIDAAENDSPFFVIKAYLKGEDHTSNKIHFRIYEDALFVGGEVLSNSNVQMMSLPEFSSKE